MVHSSKEWAKFLVFVYNLVAQANSATTCSSNPVLSCAQTAGSAQLCMLRGSQTKRTGMSYPFRLLA